MYRDVVDFDPLDGSVPRDRGSGRPGVRSPGTTPAGRFGWGADPAGPAGSFSIARGVRSGRTAGWSRSGSRTTTRRPPDFDPTDGRPEPRSRPASPAGFVLGAAPEGRPGVTIAGLPAGSVTEGTTLALAATDDGRRLEVLHLRLVGHPGRAGLRVRDRPDVRLVPGRPGDVPASP